MGFTCELFKLIRGETCTIPPRKPDPQSRVDISPLRYSHPQVTATVLKYAGQHDVSAHESIRPEWKRVDPLRNKGERVHLVTAEDHRDAEKVRHELNVCEARLLTQNHNVHTVHALLEADQVLMDWASTEEMRGEDASYPHCNDSDYLLVGGNSRARMTMKGVVYDLGATLQSISERMEEATRLPPERLFDGVQAIVRMAPCDSSNGRSILPGIGGVVYNLTAPKIQEYARACPENLFDHSYADALLEKLIQDNLVEEEKRGEYTELIRALERRHFWQPAFFPLRNKTFVYVPRAIFHFLQLLPRLAKTLLHQQPTPYDDEERNTIISALTELLEQRDVVAQEQGRNRVDLGEEGQVAVVQEIVKDCMAIIEPFRICAAPLVDFLKVHMVPLVHRQLSLYLIPPYPLHDRMVQIGDRRMTYPWDRWHLTTNQIETFNSLVARDAPRYEIDSTFSNEDQLDTLKAQADTAFNALYDEAKHRRVNDAHVKAVMSAVREAMGETYGADSVCQYFLLGIDFLLECTSNQNSRQMMIDKREEWEDRMGSLDLSRGDIRAVTIDPLRYVHDVRDAWLNAEHDAIWDALGIDNLDPTTIRSTNSEESIYDSLFSRLGLTHHIPRLTAETRHFKYWSSLERLSEVFHRHRQLGQEFVQWLAELAPSSWFKYKDRLKPHQIRLWMQILRDWGEDVPLIEDQKASDSEFIWQGWVADGWTLEHDKPKLDEVWQMTAAILSSTPGLVASFDYRLGKARKCLETFLDECTSAAMMTRHNFDGSEICNHAEVKNTYQLLDNWPEVVVFRQIDAVYSTDNEGRLLAYLHKQMASPNIKFFLRRLLLTPALRPLAIWAFNVVVKSYCGRTQAKQKKWTDMRKLVLPVPAEIAMLESLFQYIGYASPYEIARPSDADALILAWIACFNMQINKGDEDMRLFFSRRFQNLCAQLRSGGFLHLHPELLKLINHGFDDIIFDGASDKLMLNRHNSTITLRQQRRNSSVEVMLLGLCIGRLPRLLRLFNPAHKLAILELRAKHGLGVGGRGIAKIPFAELALLYLWISNGRLLATVQADPAAAERLAEVLACSTRENSVSPLAGTRCLGPLIDSVGSVLLHLTQGHAVAAVDLEPSLRAIYDEWHRDAAQLLQFDLPAYEYDLPLIPGAAPALVNLDEVDLALGPRYFLRDMREVFEEEPDTRGQARWTWAGDVLALSPVMLGHPAQDVLWKQTRDLLVECDLIAAETISSI
ncbi:hypothetical protein DFH06DRAFT_1350499 [Mycena polygramma]|nr:hypothetical protein DFH06DRAFT_1350499 [Mycena polygramma]